MAARLIFAKVPDGYESYVGKRCAAGDHEGCPGGFGVRVGFLCGGPGAGPIESTQEGAPCACGCHDAEGDPQQTSEASWHSDRPGRAAEPVATSGAADAAASPAAPSGRLA